MDVIEVRGLRKVYGSVVAVDGIDLAVAEGEVLGLLGPNGAGKTTTVECIAGLTRPSAGTVRVAGIDPAADRAAATRVLGVQLQEAGLQPRLRVGEAVDLFAGFYPDPLDGRDLVERLGLGAKVDTAYEDLSGGQKQRLAIALALIGRPKVALLDELTTGLDPQARRGVWEVVEHVRERGTTVVLVTHLMEEAHRLCDRVALVDQGRVRVLDTPDGLVARSTAPVVVTFVSDVALPEELVRSLRRLPGTTSVRERCGRTEVVGSDEAVPLLLAALARARVQPQRLRITETTLDDAYLDLVGHHPAAEEPLEA